MDSIIPPDATPQKQCKGPCGRLLPATPENFHAQGKGKYGVRSTCRECRKMETPLDEKKAYNKWYYDTHKEENSHRCREYRQTHKEEIKHRRQLPHNAEKHRQQSRNYYWHHTAERTAYNTHYYWTNRSAIVQRRKTSRETHRERLRDVRRISYYANREEILHRQRIRHGTPEAKEKRKIYDAAHAEYIKQYQHQYRRNHLEEDRLRSLNRRAMKKAIPGTYTLAQVQEQLKRQRYHCYYAACGFAKFKRVKGKYVYHIEHTFPITRVAGTDIPANDMSYLVLSCPSCNNKKHNKFPWEWPEGGRLL